MLHIDGGADSAPTHLLAEALRAAAPELLTAPVHDRNRADLTIRPRSNVPGPRPMTRDAWYDLAWTHPTVHTEDGPDGPELTIEHTEAEPAGHLPAPPRIPTETRIAAAPPVTTDHLSEDALRAFGGADAIARAWTADRDAALRDDTSAAAYDWTTYAAQVAAHVRTLTAPKLTAGQRAHAAAARLLEAHWAVTAARASARAHLHNAILAGATEDAAAVRAVLAEVDTPAGYAAA